MIMGDPGRDTNVSKAVVFTFKGFIVCLGICVVAVKIGWLQEKDFVPKERGAHESSEKGKKISGWME